MLSEAIDLQEEIRLADLYSYGILDTEEEEDFSQLLDLAASITHCPMAAITFIDKDRQWLKSVKNIGPRETSREIAFCHYTIKQDGVMLVQDARQDTRFRSNPLVTGDPHIVFYAGAPIQSLSGQKLGSVCVLDSSSERHLTPYQRKSLQVIANQVSRLLELRRKNSSLINYTNKLIEAEKALHRMSIKEEETERNFIAHQLHENFAQTLAATKLYLEFAETEKDLSASFLAKSKANVEHIINEIRLLCNYIRPVDAHQSNARFLINDFIEQWSTSSAMEVEFSMETEENLPAATGLHIYRLLQTVLPLTKTYKATKLDLQITQHDGIEMELCYMPNEHNYQDPSKLLLLKKSISLAQTEGGRLQISSSPEGMHRISIFLPLSIAA